MISYIFFAFLTFLTENEGQRNPYCKVFGSIYEVEEAYQADYIVFMESSEASSDVIVYEQSNRLYADKVGMWYFEKKPEFASHKIYFSDRAREAHFSVYFTRFESFAGCNE